jgi:hypothetical protein
MPKRRQFSRYLPQRQPETLTPLAPKLLGKTDY